MELIGFWKLNFGFLLWKLVVIFWMLNCTLQFLSENGGSSNAFTSAEHTNFFFDIKHECLQEALDR